MPSKYYVAWWNVENLFDEEHSPRRSEKLGRAIGGDLAGWTPARRDRKVAQLASVVAQMDGGGGPDLLGVCEVENRFVLELLVAALEGPLPARRYDIVHADTEDARGIDVAFILHQTTTRGFLLVFQPTDRGGSDRCSLVPYFSCFLVPVSRPKNRTPLGQPTARAIGVLGKPPTNDGKRLTRRRQASPAVLRRVAGTT